MGGYKKLTIIEEQLSSRLEEINRALLNDDVEISDETMLEIAGTREYIMYALEYVSMHRLFPLSIKLINWVMNSPEVPPEDREWMSEWGLMYKVSYHFQVRKIDEKELLNQLKSIRPKTREMAIFRKFLKIYCINFLKKFEVSIHFCEELEQDIPLIEPGYIRSSFLFRLCEIYSFTYLCMPNNLEKARFFAHKTIEEASSTYYKANTYHYLGYSYMFDDYDKALQYFLIALDMLTTLKTEPTWKIEINIIFLKNIWNAHEACPETNDQSEIAHYLIKNGRKEEGLTILQGLEPSAFRYYYMWLATKKLNYLYKSVEKFKQHKDYFFLKKMIEPELIRTGMDEKIAALICI